MKKLVKLILLCLIAYPIISIVSSCSEEEDCSMNARPMMECYLYTVDRESKRVLNDTLDSLTITLSIRTPSFLTIRKEYIRYHCLCAIQQILPY